MDGVCLLVPEAIRRLEAAGWEVEITSDGLRLTNGPLTQVIIYRDSLASLVDRGDTDDAVRSLHRDQSAR
ncbi:hypothetical protein [Streptomyces sp. NPDC048192]|uniref:hypothetical protein n=1 Tax=Streptomyces sp. NPDC048192 TaxID=3365510 RepID=UPI00371EBC85